MRQRVESEVAGFYVFSNIWMTGYYRLGYSRVKECPLGYKIGPVGRVRAPHKGAKNIR